jgi:hypothetical protein
MKYLAGLSLAAACFGCTTVWTPAMVQAAPLTQTAPGTRAVHRGKQVAGKVTVIDRTANTVTVTNPRNPTGVTLHLTPGTKINVTRPAGPGDVRSGETVEVFGDVTPGATAVTAKRILVVPAEKRHGQKANDGYHKKYVLGVVAAASPALAITTPGGVRMTVTTTLDTKYQKVAPGSFADIVYGKRIQAHVREDTAIPTATEIRILPGGHGRRGHKAAAL